MKNIHICMNDFKNASRVIKQTNSLISYNVFDEIIVLALTSDKSYKKNDIVNGVMIHRIRLLAGLLPSDFNSYSLKLFFHTLKYMEFFVKSSYFIYKAKPDVVNAHSIEVLPIALIAKKFTRCKVVYDTHELETEKNGVFGKVKVLLKIFEKQAIKKVDLVFAVSDSISDWYQNTYKIERPPVIMNVPKAHSIDKKNKFREQLDIRKDQIILLYQGNLIKGRGINLILDAFKSRTNDKVVVVFMGSGLYEQEIKLASKNYSNIFLLPAVAPEVVLEYTASADVGISLIENICLSYYYCMPNKLFEYSMAGLPVLVSNMKDMSKLVKNNQMGLVISEYSVKSINDTIDILIKDNLTEMKKNSYKTAMSLSWELQEKKMLSAYNKLLD